MKQSFASAARLRGGGPILTSGSKTMFRLGSPPPRIVGGQPDGSDDFCRRAKIVRLCSLLVALVRRIAAARRRAGLHQW